LHLVGQKDEPSHRIGCNEDDDEGGKNATDATPIEIGDREGARFHLAEQDARDQKSGDDKEYVDSDESSRNQPRVRVIRHHKKYRNCP
jgi:hypothetical protein